jgi:hypothetical protein
VQTKLRCAAQGSREVDLGMTNRSTVGHRIHRIHQVWLKFCGGITALG